MFDPFAALAPSALFALGVSAAITFLLTRRKIAGVLLDVPNARSLHVQPVPRTGGLAVLVACGVAHAVFGRSMSPTVLLGTGAVALISLVDDVVSAPAAARLAVHLGASAGVVYSIAAGQLGPAALFIAVLAIAWGANLYNFMDGSDGLAGGMAAIGFSFYGAAAVLSGNEGSAATNFIIAASATGFLLFNLHPARIFLGDVGSVTLGFLAGVLGVAGWLQEDWPFWFPALVFSPFIVDSSVTLARRLVRRDRVWEAHRDHYYQRLVRMGWGHRRTAAAEYLVMLAAGFSALAALDGSPWTTGAVFLMLAAFYVVAIRWIEIAWRDRASPARP